ncbi:cytochrome c [Oceanicella sp. SM1341]|uniref:cytochrome c n=1 Tax=Oceanicella sp. SM1341 TaxID=1548889 RepID=UPI000E50537E|nr:cytochrome c [Oceanicella sp. SM1341]
MKPLLSLAALLLAAAPALAQESAQVARGRYLATAADCGACHTAPGGQPFAGGLPIGTPLGEIVSTNITPSQAHGIGGYSLEQFSRALREGVRADGANLYPAMPYPSYAAMTDEDVAALYAYLQEAVDPVEDSPPPTELPFPFSVRASMTGWNLLFLDDDRFTPDPGHDAAWNRGAYIARALAHCSTCHTPRNALMAEDGTRALAGASLGTWYAPNITSDPVAGIGGWSAEALKRYLATGHSGEGAQAAGPMLEAIDKSLGKLTPGDMDALVTWLRDVPPVSEGAAPGRVAQAAPASADLALMAGTAPEGAQLYADHCATCHQPTGAGGNGLPPLLHNAALLHPTADNAAMAMLDGVWPEHGQSMPAFAGVMDDAEIATLTNWLFAGFGDAGVQLDAARVAELRAGGAPSPLIGLARTGVAVAGAVILLVLLGLAFWLLRRGRRRA